MRRGSSRPPFSLPAEVTDKHELIWWRIQVDVDFRVVQRRAVFHVHTKWEDFRTDDTPGGRGADLELQWAMYEGGKDRCVGRASAWNCWMNADWSMCFDNEKEARIEAAKLAQEQALYHDLQAKKFRRIAAIHRAHSKGEAVPDDD